MRRGVCQAPCSRCVMRHQWTVRFTRLAMQRQLLLTSASKQDDHGWVAYAQVTRCHLGYHRYFQQALDQLIQVEQASSCRQCRTLAWSMPVTVAVLASFWPYGPMASHWPGAMWHFRNINRVYVKKEEISAAALAPLHFQILSESWPVHHYAEWTALYNYICGWKAKGNG